MTITGLPALVSLVVGQANEFDIVASTEFLSSYFVIARKTKRTFVKTASIIVLKSRRTEGIRSFRLRVVSPTVCSPTVRVDSPTSYMSVRLRVRC